tara:strand:- start:7197 stop:8387 length:1191 start_codon:yes stop_codon:yes gene_type:complete
MNLQLALILLGVATFIGIVLFSLWQKRGGSRVWLDRPRQWLQSNLQRIPWGNIVTAVRPKELAQRVRQKEPSLVSSGDLDLAGDGRESGAQTEPMPDGSPQDDGSQKGAVGSAQALPSEIGKQPLKIDYWARLPGPTPVSRDAALSVFREHEIDLQRPRALHGRTEPGNVWVDLTTAPADEVFTDLIVSLQIADRDGAVSESELTRFNNLTYYMSESLNRSLQFDMTIEEALPEAERLARFCQEFDLLAVIHIEPPPGRGFSGPEVTQALDRAGMRLGKDDMFHLYDPRTGAGRFSLANRSESGSFSYDELESGMLRGLVLFLNVPTAPRPSQTFSDLISVATYVSTEIDGVLVDPQGKALADAQFDSIARQIRSLESSMKRYGIDPGSEEAKRLF